MNPYRMKRKRELTRLRVARFRREKQQNLDKNASNTVEDFPRSPASLRDMENIHEELGEVPARDENAQEETERAEEKEETDDDQEDVDGCHVRYNSDNEGEEDQVNEEINDEGEEVESDVEEENDDRGNEIEELNLWAQNTKIPLTRLDALLGILRRRLLPDLPKSGKTLLQTNSVEYNVRKLDGQDNRDGGELVYFGIAKYLQKIVNVDIHAEAILYLLFNIDGLPLYKSSSKQFWPILCQIFFKPDIYKPFPVAIYSGNQKPLNLQQFFEDFIIEINLLMQDGIVIDGKLFQIQIKNFICDRPARSCIKSIIGHGGYYSCERCIVQGKRVKNRTIYPSVNSEQRTDESFRRQDNPEHHNNVSPLLAIEPAIDMVKQFSLDFMHLCCLGVMKKMFNDFWLASKVTTQLSQNKKRLLSTLLILLQSQIPEEFQRTTRSLQDIAKWKATEFRFILLYAGAIVLKKVLSKRMYRHFLLLHAACRILCSTDLALRYNEQAKHFLRHFFVLSADLYGQQCQVMNMHSLIHLADDVKNMGCSLSHLTAFPFENTLGKLKKTIRSGNRPLAQVCRRLHETFNSEFQKVTLPSEITILKEECRNNNGTRRIKKLKYKEFIISKNSPNNTVLLSNGSVLRIFDIYVSPDSNTIKLKGKILRIIKSIFTYPCDSETFKMWQVKDTEIIKTCLLESIDQKMVTLDTSNEIEEKIFVIPLLH